MSLRGYIGSGTDPQRIIVDDGRFTYGFCVKEFYIWSPTFDSQVFGVLSYNEDTITQADAGDGNQIAWANYNDSTTNATNQQAIIDPDHIVIQDLYVHTIGAAASYLIVIEPVRLTEAEGVLQLVKASRQDEP